ncbi:MAG: YqeG family HAD IIIA-type phosphatase [Bacilli bacterium]|jgi:HAD superfamily phosphatase (TIGR01668 family)
MEYFVPDIYQKSIYTIDYKKLKKDGIKCLLIDLDNTLVPVEVRKPTLKNKRLINQLKEMGFKVILFSNSNRKRLIPFKEELEVDCSYFSCKPLRFKYVKIIKSLNFDESEIACIGDQFITDILGGNRIGIKTILVNPISRRGKANMFSLWLNGIIQKRLVKKRLFTVGKYYD